MYLFVRFAAFFLAEAVFNCRKGDIDLIRVCTRLADMLPSKYEDNTLQIKERSTKRTAPFFCTGSYR
ncbi:TPA: hypothetical protein ACMZ3V_001364, partial [Neisseria gonorrhoeae]